MAHPLELAEPNVIDEELIRACITTVEEIAIPEDKKREMKTETELHHVQVTSPALAKKFCCLKQFPSALARKYNGACRQPVLAHQISIVQVHSTHAP
jgi:hypothetical protein